MQRAAVPARLRGLRGWVERRAAGAVASAGQPRGPRALSGPLQPRGAALRLARHRHRAHPRPVWRPRARQQHEGNVPTRFRHLPPVTEDSMFSRRHMH